MSKKIQKAKKGSQKWIQEIVNNCPQILNSKLIKAFDWDDSEKITWVSPLSNEGYREYYDEGFLDVLKIKLEKRPLATFWPPGGPHWDALATTSNGAKILVEAKSHINEIDSPGTGAKPNSYALIKHSLDRLE